MSNQDLLTDDYVADLLAKDAQDCSLKFSTMGMEAYRSTKKPASHPKPNMRFLRNVIKDTNSHNAALLAKEAAESQARLEQLERAGASQRERGNARPKDIRNRQIGSINAILNNGKKKRDDSEAVPSGNRSGKEERSESRQHRSRSSRKETDRGRGRDHDARDDKEDRSHRRKRRRRDESASSDDNESGHRSHRRESSRHRRSKSPSRRERRHRERSTSRRRRPKSDRHHESSRRRTERRDRRPTPEKTTQPEPMSDSDPLDDFIGPAPPPKSPVRTKGRGTISAFSGIDQRFAEGYDPKLDVEMEEKEEKDWPDAVEAFRDRQKLRQAQEQRMRAAGFSEEELARWKEGAADKGEKTEADVKWAKAGEKREWDVGKVFEE